MLFNPHVIARDYEHVARDASRRRPAYQPKTCQLSRVLGITFNAHHKLLDVEIAYEFRATSIHTPMVKVLLAHPLTGRFTGFGNVCISRISGSIRLPLPNEGIPMHKLVVVYGRSEDAERYRR